MGHSSHVYMYEYKTGMLIFGLFFLLLILSLFYLHYISRLFGGGGGRREKKVSFTTERKNKRLTATGHLVFINKIIFAEIISAVKGQSRNNYFDGNQFRIIWHVFLSVK